MLQSDVVFMFGQRCEHGLVHLQCLPVIAEERDVFGQNVSVQPREDCPQSDACRLLQRISIRTGADRREGDGFQLVTFDQLETGPICALQQLFLALYSAVPHGADGVDHVPRRQTVAAGQPCLAGRTSVQGTAFGQQVGPCSRMDGSVNAANAKKLLVGGVDDGVAPEPGDVPEFNSDSAEFFIRVYVHPALTSLPCLSSVLHDTLPFLAGNISLG